MELSLSFIIPALRNAGPIIVVRDIIHCLSKYHQNEFKIQVFFLDDIQPELEINAKCYHLKNKNNCNKLFESDIVHSHGIRPDFFIFKNRSKIKGKCITTLHTNIYEEYKSNYNTIFAFVLEQGWTRIISRHDKIICLTEYMRNRYSKLINNNKLTIINNGRNIFISDRDYTANLDLTEDEINQYRSLKQHCYIIGSISVLCKRKGLNQIIKALPRLTNFAFVIIGTGAEEDNLKLLAKKLNVLDRCLFLGRKLQGNKYYSLFDIAAFPALSEGFGLSLIEAVASHVLAVCSNIQTFAELFSNKEVSFFDLNDVNSLVNAIRYALKNSDILKENAFIKYKHYYTEDIMGNNYYKFYRSIINNKA